MEALDILVGSIHRQNVLSWKAEASGAEELSYDELNINSLLVKMDGLNIHI